MVDYIELNCFVEPFVEDISDIIICELCDIGFESFDTESEYIKAYISADKFDMKAVEKNEIINRLKSDYKLSFSPQRIESKDWNAEWESNFQPIIIKDIVCVRGSFYPENKNCKYNIIINPKMSFGTGHHSTTSMMLEYISEIDIDSKNILDMGCGTSLLGIFASLRGALNVVGVDIDEWAYNNSSENAELNSVSNLKVLLGDADRLKELSKFSLVLANINRNILLNDMKCYVEHLSVGGNLVMSGFYSQDLKMIKEEAEKLGLEYVDNKEDENWIAVRFLKK